MLGLIGAHLDLVFLIASAHVTYRVLTKPVLERNLRDMLVLADERRKRAGVQTYREEGIE